jgi:hypothetical protein
MLNSTEISPNDLEMRLADRIGCALFALHIDQPEPLPEPGPLVAELSAQTTM